MAGGKFSDIGSPTVPIKTADAHEITCDDPRQLLTAIQITTNKWRDLFNEQKTIGAELHRLNEEIENYLNGLNTIQIELLEQYTTLEAILFHSDLKQVQQLIQRIIDKAKTDQADQINNIIEKYKF